MTEIEIFLIYDGTPKSFLLIPQSDIQRLAIYPFRWLRYVMFAICGARGDLSTTPEGPYVNYDRTEFADAETRCYYWPSEDCAFVDHQGLHDQLTSTEQTPCRSGFRSDVMRRDGPTCVVTQERKELCDAAHLIPWSKGDEYILRVIQLRSSRDTSAPLASSDVGIDNIRNGISLRKDLHSKLGRGAIAFIKTPNYGLLPEHIRRLQRGDLRADYITLHCAHPDFDLALFPSLLEAGANVDALFQGDGDSPPSTLILDYVYGVAAYNAWQSKFDGDFEVMKQYHDKHYKGLHTDPSDETYDPHRSQKHSRTGRRDERENDLAKAMDRLNRYVMHIRGITPEEAAERRQKEIEQEERAAQEASRNKVMEWMKDQDIN
ncbi:hypothetical protein BGW80DRAFT_1267112 [Lactifluus volemus]|nr:hypothetical protein BGW80DRAFT_1267112 [Lactifluus volemus]